MPGGRIVNTTCLSCLLGGGGGGTGGWENLSQVWGYELFITRDKVNGLILILIEFVKSRQKET